MDTNENARLAALHRYKILDTEPEKAFDDLTVLASQITGTPVATMTLVDSDRQWFKSRVGVSVKETSRDISFCAHAIMQEDLFVVRDAMEDHRFYRNPFVISEPYIRFYAGMPLITPEGHALGTLCVIDGVPRQLSDAQQDALRALGRQAQAQLELRRNLEELKQALAERDKAELQREALIRELQSALENVRQLSGLMPLCSACKLNMVIPADPEAVSPVTDGVMQVVREMKWAEGKEFEVETALREALANAIKHGCHNDPNQRVQCCVACEESGDLLIIVRDPGPGFDPAHVPSPLDDSRLLLDHGRGVHLINQFMDEVRFESGGREIQMRLRAKALAAANE